jgi:hypothetical protein
MGVKKNLDPNKPDQFCCRIKNDFLLIFNPFEFFRKVIPHV